MAIKVNDHVIPDWAIEGQAQSSISKCGRENGWSNHRRLSKWPPLTWPRTGLIDQTLMSQESLRRKYEVDPGEVNQQMKQWIRQNGGKKAFEAGKHPVIKDKESLRKEVMQPDSVHFAFGGGVKMRPCFGRGCP